MQNNKIIIGSVANNSNDKFTKTNAQIFFINEIFPKNIELILIMEPEKFKYGYLKKNLEKSTFDESQLCSAINMKILKVTAVINKIPIEFSKNVMQLDNEVFIINHKTLEEGFKKTFCCPSKEIKKPQQKGQDSPNIIIPCGGFFDQSDVSKCEQMYLQFRPDSTQVEDITYSQMQTVDKVKNVFLEQVMSPNDRLDNYICNGNLKFSMSYKNLTCEENKNQEISQMYESTKITKINTNDSFNVIFSQSNAANFNEGNK